VCHKGIPIRWVFGGESSHAICLWVQLLVEENGEVTHYHISQDNAGGMGSAFHIALSSLAFAVMR